MIVFGQVRLCCQSVERKQQKQNKKKKTFQNDNIANWNFAEVRSGCMVIPGRIYIFKISRMKLLWLLNTADISLDANENKQNFNADITPMNYAWAVDLISIAGQNYSFKCSFKRLLSRVCTHIYEVCQAPAPAHLWFILSPYDARCLRVYFLLLLFAIPN